MKTILFSILFFVGTAIAGPVDILAESKYPRFIEFPDDEGVLRLVDLEAKPNTKLLEEIERNAASNEYYLFTRLNPTTPQRLFHSANSILESNFDASKPTVVSVHGWWGHLNSPNNIVVKDAFLSKDDVNVIVLDWRQFAGTEYPTAVAAVPVVGAGLGQFIIFLSGISGASLSAIHLVGFSLGAHLVGNAGKQLNGKVARVTGLDPAGPLWDQNPNRLQISDGIYVEGIHTDAGSNGLGIGFLRTVGHVDFYPNGGATQPGCTSSQCNHDRAWQQFAATVIYNHLVGRQCSGNIEIVNDTCRGNYMNMGNNDLHKWGFGLYRVNTGNAHPF